MGDDRELIEPKDKLERMFVDLVKLNDPEINKALKREMALIRERMRLRKMGIQSEYRGWLLKIEGKVKA